MPYNLRLVVWILSGLNGCMISLGRNNGAGNYVADGGAVLGSWPVDIACM